MIFKTVTIHNLFSYYGEVCFDLARQPGESGNIVVIQGRNGYGKTSFLNSIKLLFGGVTKELMAGMQRGSPGTQKSFVLGSQDWWGILNHKARAKGETRCGVSAVLLDETNQETRIMRSWDLHDDDYKDRLIVQVPRKPEFSKDEAQQYLSRILPLDYIPFFFFDAEEVGYLAEANRNQTIEKMEQLLNIRPVDNVQDCLKQIRRDWGRLALRPEAQLELLNAEHRRETLELLISEREQEREQIVGDIDESEAEIRRLQQKIRLLRGTGNIESVARLDAEKRKEVENLEVALSALSSAFEHDAFLRVNPHLAQKAMQTAESCASSQDNATSELLASLKGPLKEVFITPPYPDNRLHVNQVRFYQERILKVLESRDVSVDKGCLFRMETGRAKRLSNLLAAYQPECLAAETIRENIASTLKADNAIMMLENQLQNVRQLSEDDKMRLVQLEHELAQTQDDSLNKRDRARKIENDVANARRELAPLMKQIESLQQKAKESHAAKIRLNLLDNMRHLLEAYKQELKMKMREELEHAFNRHLKQLLDSSELVHSAHIDDDFLLSYRDRTGDSIPMGSLSAGMKQLAATALLWGLKDASGSNLPVIIDTPLGRIDRLHQENLLTQYYPHAAEQAILLPTDSELDDRKYALLAPHIYREIHLHNPSGGETRLELIKRQL